MQYFLLGSRMYSCRVSSLVRCCRSSPTKASGKLIVVAVMIVPTTLPHDLRNDRSFRLLSETVRDLASDNIMCAVMLTGVMLLQACPPLHRIHPPMLIAVGRSVSLEACIQRRSI